MTDAPMFTQRLSDCGDASLVGGKAANLGRLARAGFPVPDGFVVTTRAYVIARERSTSTDIPSNVAEEITAAYRAIGAGTVAVRSSATAEDMADASMAGQYETFLGVEGEAALLDAVRGCWASLEAPRVQAYLREHGIDASAVAMGVVVQRLVPADVAGVLFTVNPQEDGDGEMVIEASWGLGESVVSGRVQPDVLRLERETGRVLRTAIADQQVHLAAGARDERSVEGSRRRQPCLGGRDVYRLWQLGGRVAGYFGSPQDIEWAIHGGEVYLLQARPITVLGGADGRAAALREVREHLAKELSAGRGPWVLHNLAETCPHPTPLTWSVLARFMSGRGGLGAMYRQAGFEPSPTVDREGFLELIAGRVYMDISRAPEMFFEDFPFAYDVEELKRCPDASQTLPTLARGSFLSRAKAGQRLAAVEAKLHTLAEGFDGQLWEVLFPALTKYVADAKKLDLPSLSDQRLIELWREHETRVLDTFGAQALMPGLICAMAMGELRTFLAEQFWSESEDPGALAQLISSGGPPDRTLIADAELYDLGKKGHPLEAWLADHGHRAPGEFDLAVPRWREQPSAVLDMAARLASGDGPMDRYYRNRQAVDQRAETLRRQLARRELKEFDGLVNLVRRYVAMRENGKDVLMQGYELLREVAIEAGRRQEVGEDVFYLTREELFESLTVGYAPFHVIEQRKAAHRAEARIELPEVIDAKAVAALGERCEVNPSAGGHQGLAISSGEATGAARILRSPGEGGDLGRGYILVCPSTDPAWTPLFANAAGLVLERGGALSHGAVVAREMGLPAVVLPGATRLFGEGEEIRVDGRRGWVGRATDEAAPSQAEAAIGADDTRISHDLIPPPPGRRDRRAARLRNVLALVWAAYLLGFFLLPGRWVYGPSLAAMDTFLWPVVRWLGKPAAVAIVAASMAALTLFVQRVLPDNRRLREAKRRACALRVQAESRPRDSRRRAALTRMAGQVTVRTLAASLVPIGVLLGPMVMPLVWFKARVDQRVWNAPAGSAVQIVAIVDGEWKEPVRIDVPLPVVVDEATPAVRTLPPIRRTLERLLALYDRPRGDMNEPWELKVASDSTPQQTAEDLRAYLAGGIPPQGITWLLRPPEGMSGRFGVRVAADGRAAVAANVVLGDEYAPGARDVAGPAGSPVKELRVVYPQPKQAPVFWQPLAGLAGHDSIPWTGRLAAIDLGWVWLYVLTYLVALVFVRAMLRVA